MITNATPQTAVTANDIRDIKPPVPIPNGWEWVWWTLGALAVLAILYFAWRYWQKRRSQISVEPPLPAHIRAKQMLEKALELITQPKPFCILVSDTVRVYLEERFNFRAPERTTEEFLRELNATDLLLPEQKESLGKFLESCDLVKFAKYEPGENELHELHSSAVKLVEETEPKALPEREQPATETDFRKEEKPSPISIEIPIKREMQNSLKGRNLAIIGTLLQLGPGVWIVAYLVMIFRLLVLSKNLPQSVPSKGLEAITELYSKMISIYGDALVLVCLGLLAGAVGLVLLTISLISLRYRSEWFFWFLIIYGILLLGPFPCVGTAVGIFFIVYCLTKRREFFNQT